MNRTRALIVSVILTIVAACGGGSNNGGSNPPPGGGTTPGTNPCTTALLADTAEVAAVGSVAQAGGATSDKKKVIDGDPRGRVYEALALHEDGRRAPRSEGAHGPRARKTAPAAGRTAITAPAPVGEDVGDVAVHQRHRRPGPAAEQLRRPQHRPALHAQRRQLHAVAHRRQLPQRAGQPRHAVDDDSANVNIPFSFPFYGVGQTAAFVNSDGNITFGEEDKSSTERNIARLLTGPPRVAPFFADLDPTQGTARSSSTPRRISTR
jgi:hypothetical protein